MLNEQTLFWGSAFLILYPYVGYVGVLWLLARFKQPQSSESVSFPTRKVTLLISAYNEEATIEHKIRNSLALAYPKDLLEIVVVSDGSTDKTCEIVSRYAAVGLKLRHYEGRMGKTSCLNRAVPLAEGEIIVFSDANAHYPPNTIAELVRHFDDPKVGFVTGSTRYVTTIENHTEAVGESMSLYARFQHLIKDLESTVGSCIGADGAIFAIRKSYYEELDHVDINDLVLPLKILKRGAVGKLASGAVCTEDAVGSPQAQFCRQVRIANRTIRALIKNIDLANPLKFGLISFQLLSGKVLKMLCPIFMVVLLISNLCLLKQHWLYALSFLAQFTVYSMVWLTSEGITLWRLSRGLSVAHTFIVVNLAIGLGWLQYLKGETYATWAPVRR